jgi:RecA/RadA recombinase
MKKKKIGNYFTNEKSLDFIPSGCQLLDLILGGGWAVGRVSNVIGDESTGKSLVASEACANAIKTSPKGRIFYHEVESAFDKQYGEMLGMPVDKMTFVREKINDNW